jgi:endonuclease III
MTNADLPTISRRLKKAVKQWRETSLAQEARTRDPFRVLISCIISLRTKDEVTAEASARLYKLADTPDAMRKLPEQKIAKAIYPAGFYKTKSKSILGVCEDIMNRFDGQTPDTIDELLTFKGVGRKTANLVVTMGFNKPGICVDTHVHRISNRWGYVKTKNPDATEMALRDKLPRIYWIPLNDLMVSYGQNLCKPISPHCSICTLTEWCDRVGVTKSR